jgi:addiction module HigA family antidote
MAMRNPVHPGGFIRTEILAAYGLSVTDGAKALGVGRPALSNLLNQRADLSAEMALRVEKAFGVSMDTLMRMQTAYDVARARREATKIRVSRYRRARGRTATRPAPGRGTAAHKPQGSPT